MQSWCILFDGGQTNVHNKESGGRPKLWLTQSEQILKPTCKKIGMTSLIWLKFFNTIIQMSVFIVLSIFEIPIIMSFHFKTCFEFVSHNCGPTLGFFVVDSRTFVRSASNMMLYYWTGSPLFTSHYRKPQLYLPVNDNCLVYFQIGRLNVNPYRWPTSHLVGA